MRACVCVCMFVRAWVCTFMFLCAYTCTRTCVCIKYPLTSATHHIFHCLPGHLHPACCEPILSVSQRCPHIDQCVHQWDHRDAHISKTLSSVLLQPWSQVPFDKPISPSSIPLIWKLGSTYMGCFQAPVMKDSVSLKIESFL